MVRYNAILVALASSAMVLHAVRGHPSSGPIQQRSFSLDPGSAADDRLGRLLGDLDIETVYPVDAQRLARLTPKLIPGHYNRMAKRHRQQVRALNDRNQEAWRLEKRERARSEQRSGSSAWLRGLVRQGVDGRDEPNGEAEHDIYRPAYITQPVDHFDNTTQATFEQKFYYSLRHYVPSRERERKGEAVPVFILDSGEAAVEARLPFLESGIVDILANATGGIGIVLEHRYYGTSTPKRADLGPGEVWGADELRWLNNKQALEDSAEFIRRLQIEGTDNDEPRKVIYYGGSYPGARSAHMRVLYPDLVHGAIASSAVVAAIDEFPEYFYPIARGADTSCSQAIQAAVAGIDAILAPDPHAGSVQPTRNETEARKLLGLFGLEELSEPADLANLLTQPLGAFQSLNWDPNVTSTEFGDFCTTLNSYGRSGYGPHSQSQASIEGGLSVPREVHAYAKYIRSNYVLPCLAEGGGGGSGWGNGDDGDDDDDGGNPQLSNAASNQTTADACFGSEDLSSFVNATHLGAGKAWTYQYCTTWGYIMTAPPVPGWTAEGRPVLSGPKLVSTLLDYRFAHDICERGFPDGKVNKVPPRPNVREVNEIGGFALESDRLAFVDGQYDPWRPATTHSEEFAYGGARADTLARPFKLIPDCWHHCDENGVKDPSRTPERVRRIHRQQIEFVRAWLREE